MAQSIEAVAGFDVGDRTISVCVVDLRGGSVLERATIATERVVVREWLARRSGLRVVVETGTHTPWLARLIAEVGHEVVVADARRVKLITDSRRKTDRRDAELLARLGRSDLELLRPVRVRSEVAQRDRGLLRMRDALVRSRSLLINCVRGVLKTEGLRVPKCSAEAFARTAWDTLPEACRARLAPILRQIAQITRSIRGYDRQIAAVLEERHPQAAERLDQVAGVGPVTALALISAVEDPRRFRSGRQMSAYFGLVPRLDQSGGRDPRLPISKEGDTYVRRLLVSAAHYVLARGPDTELKRWGLSLEARWGDRSRSRAAVAVARKLAVLLWRLWTTGETYVPLRSAA